MRWTFAVMALACSPMRPAPATRAPAPAPTTDAATPADVPAVDAPPAPMVLGFAGDVALLGGSRHALAAVAPWMQDATQTWVNLETVVAEQRVGVAQDKAFVFRSPPETVAVLRAAGVDGVALANNHSLDYGPAALARTMALVDEGGLQRAGAGLTTEAAYAPARSVVAGRRVAVLSVCRMNQDYPWAPRDGRAGIASARPAWEAQSVAAVAAARRDSDVVVVMVHWGTEITPCPTPEQRRLARRWVAAGASAVVGSHPHVLQGVERVGEAWVLYSTGNFAFPTGSGETSRSAFFELGFGRSLTLRARPVVIEDAAPGPPSQRVRREVLGLLSRRSHDLAFDADGNATASHDRSECPWPSLVP